MNAAATPISRNGVVRGPELDAAGDNDSDAYSDGVPEYYQPISAIGDEDDEDTQDGGYSIPPENGRVNRLQYHEMMMARMTASMDWNEEGGGRRGEEEEEEGEEEERTMAESDSAMRRAFQQDESRRNAPLTPENATRVMQAMRGVSFGGLVPDWARGLPEDQWVDQLRRLRLSPI